MDQLDAESKAAMAPAVAVAAEAATDEEVAPFNEDVFRVREGAAGVSYR